MKLKENSTPDRFVRVAIGAVLAIAFLGALLYFFYGWDIPQ